MRSTAVFRGALFHCLYCGRLCGRKWAGRCRLHLDATAGDAAAREETAGALDDRAEAAEGATNASETFAARAQAQTAMMESFMIVLRGGRPLDT